jgi:hypothetical protein
MLETCMETFQRCLGALQLQGLQGTHSALRAILSSVQSTTCEISLVVSRVVQVAMEILTTERSYCESLTKLSGIRRRLLAHLSMVCISCSFPRQSGLGWRNGRLLLF